MTRRTGPTQAVRDQVFARDRMACIVCETSYDLQVHHRRPRGMGSTRRPESNLPGNLILVCRDCHSRIESSRDLARERGHLVSQRETPSEVPLIWHGEWTLLADDGSHRPSLPLNLRCAVTGCGEPAHGRGHCSTHLQRLVKYGTTDPTPRVLTARAIEALWSRMQTPEATGDGECWEWPGSRNPNGYGTTKRNGENVASRAAWVEVYGPIPAGLFVCHRCDNPPCVRPSHLFLGRPADNTQDMLAKGRARAPRSLANGRAKLSDEQVAEIRRQVEAGRRHRDIADDFGICAPHVGRIYRRERRTTVPLETADLAARDVLISDTSGEQEAS